MPGTEGRAPSPTAPTASPSCVRWSLARAIPEALLIFVGNEADDGEAGEDSDEHGQNQSKALFVKDIVERGE